MQAIFLKIENIILQEYKKFILENTNHTNYFKAFLIQQQIITKTSTI